MKKIGMAVIAIMVLSFSTMAVGKDKVSKIEEYGAGIFSQYINKAGLHYLVDTQTHLCLASMLNAQGTAEIPCEKLALRPEWKPIITWVK